MKSVANIDMDEVAYAEWSCICVGDSYDETCSYGYDRIYWIPSLVSLPKPPPPPPLCKCKNREKWECIIVYAMLEEIGAKEKSEFIRKSGGLATEEQLSEYKNKRQLY